MTLRNIEELTRRVELEFDLRKKRRLANALAGKIVRDAARKAQRQPVRKQEPEPAPRSNGSGWRPLAELKNALRRHRMDEPS